MGVCLRRVTHADRRRPSARSRAAPTARTAEAYTEFLRAQRLEDADDADGAIAAYKRAMELDPSAADIGAELAGLYMRDNRAEDAVDAAERALKLDPENASAHEVLGTIYASMAGQSQSANTNSPAARTEQHDNLLKAIDHLERAIANPEGLPDANTRAMLSRLYVNNGEYGKAIPMLADLVKQEPGWQEGAVLLAQAYSGAGRTAEAVSLLEEAAKENPQLYPTLADFYGRDERWKDAADRVREGTAPGAAKFRPARRLRSALLNAGGAENAAKAQDVLREAVAARAHRPARALSARGGRARLGRSRRGRGHRRRLIAQNRNSPRAYVALAETLEERQHYQAVVDALAPAIADFRAPRTPTRRSRVLLPHVGFAYQQVGKFDKRDCRLRGGAARLTPITGHVRRI